MEGVVGDGGYILWERDGGQGGAVGEGVVADVGE